MGLVLVAAHPDDELLGGYELLRRGPESRTEDAPVVWFARVPTSDEMLAAGRYEESRAYAAQNGHRVVTPFEELCVEQPVLHVAVPHPTDDHPEHRVAQARGLAFAQSLNLPWSRVVFYSIQKRHATRAARTPATQREVERLFAEHFPSQRAALTDPVYTIFAGWPAYVSQTVTVRGGPGDAFEVTGPAGLSSEFCKFLGALRAFDVESDPLSVALRLRASISRSAPDTLAQSITLRVHRAPNLYREVTV